MAEVSFAETEKALTSLQNALARQPADEFLRDAVIQRFEYTFELIWKVARKVIAVQGIVSNSPRSVIRDLGQQGWIDDVEAWMKFLDERNLTTHTYNQSVVQEVYESAKRFAPECRRLLDRLKTLSPA